MLELKGVVGREVALLFREQLAGLGTGDEPIFVDLSEASFENEAVLELVVDGLQQVSKRLSSVHVRSAAESVQTALRAAGLTT